MQRHEHQGGRHGHRSNELPSRKVGVRSPSTSRGPRSSVMLGDHLSFFCCCYGLYDKHVSISTTPFRNWHFPGLRDARGRCFLIFSSSLYPDSRTVSHSFRFISFSTPHAFPTMPFLPLLLILAPHLRTTGLLLLLLFLLLPPLALALGAASSLLFCLHTHTSDVRQRERVGGGGG